MRFLKIVSSHDDGGVLTCETQYLKYLHSQNIKVDLIIVGTGKNLGLYRSLGNEVEIIENLSWGYSGGIMKRARGILETYKYGKKHETAIFEQFKEIDYDAVLCRRPNFLFLAGILAKRFKIRAYWHLPGIVSSVTAKYIYSVICHRYPIVPIANSKFTKKTLNTICYHYVYPGFDQNRVKESEENLRERLGINPSAPVYGMIARICTDKAQDLLIEGFLKSKIIENGGHLLIAGAAKDVNFMDYLNHICNDYLGKNIHFLGKVSDLSLFYATIDVAVNSRRNAEAFGISVAEALGNAKPVIAYHLGGPSEMIEHDVNGWLVDSSTPMAYCKAFDISLKNKFRWINMGKAGKLKSPTFSVSHNVDKMINIITNAKK